MTVTIYQLLGDVAAVWGTENPVLLEREPGIETNTRRWKIGDGVTAWNDLPYVDSGTLPVGGTAGQFLIKSSSDDYDVEWASPPALDDQLAAIAALTPAANQIIYWTGPTGAAMTSFTTFGRGFVGSVDAAAARAALSLGSAALKAMGNSGDVVPSLSGINIASGVWTFSAGIVIGADITATTERKIIASGTNGKSVTLEQTGDQWGASRLVIMNRDGFNGALFQTDHPTVQLVDFVFSTSAAGSHNIRYERRAAQLKGAGATWEFQFGTGGTPSFAVGDRGTKVISGSLRLPRYTVAGLPTASQHTDGLIIVSNEVGGLTPAFSDGTNWRRVHDRAIVA